MFTVLSVFLLSAQATPSLFDQGLKKRDFTGKVCRLLESFHVLMLITDRSGSLVLCIWHECMR